MIIHLAGAPTAEGFQYCQRCGDVLLDRSQEANSRDRQSFYERGWEIGFEWITLQNGEWRHAMAFIDGLPIPEDAVPCETSA